MQNKTTSYIQHLLSKELKKTNNHCEVGVISTNYCLFNNSYTTHRPTAVGCQEWKVPLPHLTQFYLGNWCPILRLCQRAAMLRLIVLKFLLLQWFFKFILLRTLPALCCFLAFPTFGVSHLNGINISKAATSSKWTVFLCSNLSYSINCNFLFFTRITLESSPHWFCFTC